MAAVRTRHGGPRAAQAGPEDDPRHELRAHLLRTVPADRGVPFALHRLDLTRPHVLSRVVGAPYDQATGRKLTRPIMVDINLIPDAELEPRTAVPPAAAGINERDLVGQLLQRLVARTRTAPDGYPHHRRSRHAGATHPR